MAIPAWQPGTLYQPNAVVRPVADPTISSGAPDNADFEAGVAGWGVPANWDISEVPSEAFEGSWRARFLDPDGPSGGILRNDNQLPVVPGQRVGGWAFVQPIAGGRGAAALEWLDDASSIIKTDRADWISGSAGFWIRSEISAVAPASAAFVRLAPQAEAFAAGDGALFDKTGHDYSFRPESEGLVFQAVQAEAGTSGSSEPDWPTVVGNQVVDKEVTWEAVQVDRVVWEARDILVSGVAEPAFPANAGAYVVDNTIAWEAVPQRVVDAEVPQSGIVAIGASKVFTGDDDVIGFSATVNPLDWSTRQDAGFLPFSLNPYGSQPVTAMGLYRGNLVAFSTAGFQMWQIDEDPASMALLDSVPIGCEFHRSLQPVSDDLLFLSQLGVRNISIAGGSTNLKAGDLGKPVDPLVQQAIRHSRDYGYEPRALYYPAAGQYWLFTVDEYEGADHCVAYVMTMDSGRSWSRYVWPALDAEDSWLFNDWAILDGELYLMFGPDGGESRVVRVSDEAVFDDQATTETFAQVGNGLSLPATGDNAITKLNATDVAYIDQDTDELRAYRFDGVDFAQLPGVWQIATDNLYSLTPMDTDTICLATNNTLALLGYDSEGGQWLQLGTPTTVSGSGGPGIAGLGNGSELAFVDDVDFENLGLRRYAFDFQQLQFVQQGNTLLIPAGGQKKLTALNETDVALITGGSATLQAYRYDGVDWVPLGNGLSIPSANLAEITLTAINATDVAYIDDTDEQLRVFRFDGVNWTEVYTPASVACDTPAVSALSPTEVAFIDRLNDELRVYRLGDVTTGEPIRGVMQWPWLDMGEFGRTKQLIGFDVTGNVEAVEPEAAHEVAVSVGYDQTDLTAFTTPYETGIDSMVGGIVPLPVAGPSFSLKLEFPAGQRWELLAANLYLQDLRRTS